jgi:hypothetical protein
VRDSRRGQELARQAAHPIPFLAVLLAASLERSSPEVEDGAERRRARGCSSARRSSESIPRRPATPSPLLGDRPAHALAQAFLDLLELRPHASGSGLPLDPEPPLLDLSRMKPRKAKVYG